MTLMTNRSALLVLLPLAGACASAAPAPGVGGGVEEVWTALAAARPEPLAGAPRIAVGEITLTGDAWSGDTPVPAAIGLQELIAASLLRRPDVQFVERRRFGAAVERERRGLPRPAGAPPLGTSPGPELVLLGNGVVLGDSAYLDLRLLDPEGGEVRAGWRVATPRSADPAALARLVTGTLVATLAGAGRAPRWEDPLPHAAPLRFTPSGVPDAGWRAFLAGVAAEDRYDWEAARAAYQRALQAGGSAFFEAEAALARAARLRTGGTLGAS